MAEGASLKDGLLRHARTRLKRLANGEAQADVARSFAVSQGDDQQAGCTESIKSMLFGAA